MLRITVEMIPRGDESRKYFYCMAEIANDAVDSKETGGEYGSYEAKFYQNVLFNSSKIWKRGKASGIHRKRRGFWDILFCCLWDAGLYERNKAILEDR